MRRGSENRPPHHDEPAFFTRKANRRRLLRLGGDSLLYLLIVCGLAWMIVRQASSGGYNWQWFRAWPALGYFENGEFYAGPLLKGLGNTLAISAAGMVLAVCCGLAASAMRLFGGPAAKAVAVGYVGLIRNTPLLVHLFLIYFFLALVFNFGAMSSAILALGLFEGAYMAEIFRAGVQSVPQGQLEAARSLGLGNGLAFIHVTLPQAVRNALPPLVSQGISLIKDSSLAGSIAIMELSQQGRLLISDQFTVFEIWLMVAAIYLLLALALSGLSVLLKKRLNRGFAA